MSSHHIVREKQEPALLVLGLADFSFEQLGQLLEWSPTVIATPLIAEELNSLGLKIDWVVGGDSSVSIQSDIKNILLENEGVLHTALKFLIANGYPSVNIVTDEFEFGNYANYVEQINIVVFNNHKKIYAIASNFKKWKPAGEKIEVLTSVDNLKVEGLQNIGANKFITTCDGFFGLTFDGPFLFITEEN